MTDKLTAADVLADPIETIVAGLDKHDDTMLASLLTEERKADTPRSTLIPQIEAEQQRRKDAAAEADAKAKEQGFADAKTKAATEKAQAAKATARKKPSKSKQASGFTAKAVDKDGAEAVLTLASDGGEVKIALGNANGPRKELSALSAPLTRHRGKSVNERKVTFATAALPGPAELTHVYVFAGDADPAKSAPLGRYELPVPIAVMPGEQIQFRERTLAL